MERAKGIFLIITGAVLWGATGPIMEWILSNTKLSVSFMLTLRLLIAGAGMILFIRIQGNEITSMWKSVYWIKRFFLFSILGMLGLQFSFVSAIEASNAVVATLLQFLAPIFVVVFVSLDLKKWPPTYQIIGITGTLVGLFLLLTNGSMTNLVLSPAALGWGITVGLSFAFYTLYPAALMKEWGVFLVVGWSMLFAGIILALITRIWESTEWIYLMDVKLVFFLTMVIVFGTLAFVLFLSSMKYISAIETSILSSLEPLTAMVISVLWLQQILGLWQWVGALFMLIFVTWLSISGKKDKKPADI
ncbi:MAG: DMT family transporter [Paenisporosarcina sp.]